MSRPTAKPASAAKKVASKKTITRKPGRPAGAGNGMLNRETVLSIAFRLTKSVPLAELSVVLLARELGVTPALIHYYFSGGGRNALTSGVMNLFYRELVEQWPASLDDRQHSFEDWKHNFEIVADAVYRAHLRYPGISMYVSSYNRYQLVQDVSEDETDYGLVFIEKFTHAVQQAGFDAERTGIFAHLLLMFITSCAHSTVTRRWPGQHSEFLDAKLSSLDPEAFPSTYLVRETIIHLDAPRAFATGLRLMLQSLEVERQLVGKATATANPVRGSRRVARN